MMVQPGMINSAPSSSTHFLLTSTTGQRHFLCGRNLRVELVGRNVDPADRGKLLPHPVEIDQTHVDPGAGHGVRGDDRVPFRHRAGKMGTGLESGRDRDIYNGPRFQKPWVEDPARHQTTASYPSFSALMQRSVAALMHLRVL